jgi:hypothetical protein
MRTSFPMRRFGVEAALTRLILHATHSIEK